jgi:nitrite reductase (NADH) small subunit
MSAVKIGRLAHIPPGGLVHAEVAGGQYAVCNVGGRLYAVDGICPHAGGPLGHGALHGHFIVCPFHAWAFDCRTGQFEGNERVRLKTFTVLVEGDDVLIDVPQRAGTA